MTPWELMNKVLYAFPDRTLRTRASQTLEQANYSRHAAMQWKPLVDMLRFLKSLSSIKKIIIFRFLFSINANLLTFCSLLQNRTSRPPIPPPGLSWISFFKYLRPYHLRRFHPQSPSEPAVWPKQER